MASKSTKIVSVIVSTLLKEEAVITRVYSDGVSEAKAVSPDHAKDLKAVLNAEDYIPTELTSTMTVYSHKPGRGWLTK